MHKVSPKLKIGTLFGSEPETLIHIRHIIQRLNLVGHDAETLTLFQLAARVEVPPIRIEDEPETVPTQREFAQFRQTAANPELAGIS